jgi:glycine cleavage system pyridoxal-binding protein P
MSHSKSLTSVETFESRHIGLNPKIREELLKTLGVDSIETLISKTIPKAFRIPNFTL